MEFKLTPTDDLYQQTASGLQKPDCPEKSTDRGTTSGLQAEEGTKF